MKRIEATLKAALPLLAGGVVGHATASDPASFDGGGDGGGGPETIVWQPGDGRDPYLELGSEPQFAAVGAIGTIDSFGAIDYDCSAVLVGRTTALTAAHCSVFSRLRLRDHRKRLTTREYIVFPGASFTAGDGCDIMIIKLDQRGAYFQEPAGYVSQPSPLGTIVTQVGNGRDFSASIGDNGQASHYDFLAGRNSLDGLAEDIPASLFPRPPILFDGLRYHFIIYGSLGLDPFFGADIRVYQPSRDFLSAGREWAYDLDGSGDPGLNLLGSPDPVDLEGGIAGGDSGGPMFVETPDGWRVAGLSSYGAWPENASQNGWGSISVNTQISPFAEWIDDHLHEAAWDHDVLGVGAFDDPMNWWADGERAVPSADQNLVFRLSGGNPTIQCNGSIDPQRDPLLVMLTQDRSHPRMRVRWESDVTLDLGGHTLSLTSESASTTALVVGSRGGWPALRIQNGTLVTPDASLAESGSYVYHRDAEGERPGRTSYIGWTYGIIDVDGGVLDVQQTLLVGDRLLLHEPYFEGSDYRIPPGKGLIRVRGNGEVRVGDRLRLGRSVDSRAIRRSEDGCSVSGEVELCGELQIEDGSVLVGDAAQPALGTLAVGDGGLVESAGVISGDVRNGGVFEIIDRFPNYGGRWEGNIFDSWYVQEVIIRRGQTRIDGDFVQAAPGRLEMDIEGTVPYDDHDSLLVSGEFVCGGTLAISFDNGYEPVLGEPHMIIEAGSLSGQFDSVEVEGLASGLTVDVEHDGTNVVVTARCLVDFNGDGLLDLSDINAFTGAFVGGQQLADLNGDGLLDLRDINIFTGHFIAGCP
jgi:hypothetical protein